MRIGPRALVVAASLVARRASSLAPMRPVSVVSYNVLSSSLAAPDYYTFCKPENLLGANRLKKLLSKLEVEVQRGSLICLQEVSMVWAGHLHAFFSTRGYHLATGLYGSKFNGYMGVALAVPVTRFDIAGCDISRVADTKPSYRRPVPSLVAKILAMIWNPLRDWLQNLKILTRKVDAWSDAERRFNQMIAVRLRCKESDRLFWVSTYHMPCMFKCPPVMTIHCALAAQHMQRLAGVEPYVLVGDWNVKPSSAQYRMLTEGVVPEGDDAAPERENDPFRASVLPLRSAYKEFFGAEPALTNWGQAKDQEPFIDTLDYIFTSAHWRVVSANPIPAVADIKGPLPNDEEMSDHLLIAAELELE